MTPFEMFLLTASDTVLDIFFNHWTPDIIIRIRTVNSRVYFAVEAYRRRAWNVDEFFSTWFLDPSQFREALGRFEAVVAGSQSLQFLSPTGRTLG